jgi:hypothetical protein
MCGIYLVTLGITGRLLLTTESGRWKRRSEIKWIIVIVSGLLFVDATLDHVVAEIQLVQGFVLYMGPGHAEHILNYESDLQPMTKVRELYMIPVRRSRSLNSLSVFHFKRFSVTVYW